ncbi:TPA: hypothetical protein ENS27_06780 [bacterium]|nr:hypothetical protein [bacterium]
MTGKQLLGIIGAILLIAGLFLPLVKIPLLGSISFYENNQAEAIVIIALSAISIVFILAKRYSLLWFSNIAIMALMSATGIQLVRKLLKVKSKTEGLIGKNLTDKIADKVTNIAMDHVKIQWGVAILLIGLLLVILCAIIGTKGRKKSPSVSKQIPQTDKK